MILDYPLSPQHRIARTGEELGAMVREMREAPERAFDFETTGLRFASGAQPIGYGIGFRVGSEHRAWYVPFGHVTAEPQADPASARRALKDALSGALSLIGHNLKFDLNMGRAHGFEIPSDARIHDSLTQAYLIYEQRSMKLEKLAESVSPWGDSWQTTNAVATYLQSRAKARKMRYEKDDKENGDPSYLSVYGHSEVPVAMEAEYCCRDVGHTLALDRVQRDQALAVGTAWEDRRRILYENEMLLVRALADMEYHGQIVDGAYLLDLASGIDERLSMMSRELSRMFGASIDWSNDNEVRNLLYEHLKLPVVRKTEKEEKPAVDRTALLLLRHHFNPDAMNYLAEYNAWDKARETYTKSLAWYVDHDGRIHPSFLGHGAKSGRLSGLNPNLQNIPFRHAETAKAIRKAFIVESGFARLYADYSQIELRLLAHITGCATLLRAYHSEAYERYLRGDLDYWSYFEARKQEPKRDVHDEVTSQMFHIDHAAPNWKVRRRAGKIINFGVPYGMGPQGLQSNPELMLSEDEAKSYFDAYHAANPEIDSTKQVLFRKMLAQDGQPFFVNWAGRTVHCPELRARSRGVRGEGERSSFASLIQGSAAELMRFLLVRLWWESREGRLPAVATSTVHDEVQLDCRVEDLREVARIVQHAAEDFTCFGSIPIISNLETSTSTWADKKEYEL